MKLLYLSCHSVLEFEEISMFRSLGIEIFSPGAYVEPANPGDPTSRPGLQDMGYDPDITEQWHKLAGSMPGIDPKAGHLTKEFVDNFDAVMVMHIPEWIINNWEAMKHKVVIWRTIGQSIQPQEQKLAPYREQGLKIVRYSPAEERIPSYIGGDAMIRFYKNPEEFNNWNGDIESALTINQSLPKRMQHCNGQHFINVASKVPVALAGPNNEEMPYCKHLGKLPFDQLKQAYRDYRAYLYLGTHPASYTLNFMEAWMTAIPMIVPGPKLGNPTKHIPNHPLYEVHELIDNGNTGFIADDADTAVAAINYLIRNKDQAIKMGTAGRAKAIALFGIDIIQAQWKAFFDELF